MSDAFGAAADTHGLKVLIEFQSARGARVFEGRTVVIKHLTVHFFALLMPATTKLLSRTEAAQARSWISA